MFLAVFGHFTGDFHHGALILRNRLSGILRPNLLFCLAIYYYYYYNNILAWALLYIVVKNPAGGRGERRGSGKNYEDDKKFLRELRGKYIPHRRKNRRAFGFLLPEMLGAGTDKENPEAD